MLANLCYGFGASLGKRKENFSPLMASFLISTSATFVVWSLWFLRGGQLATFSNLSLRDLAFDAHAGCFRDGSGFFAFLPAPEAGGGCECFADYFFGAGVGSISGPVFFSERLSAVSELAGMVLIGLGLAVLDGRPWRYVSRTARRRRAPLEP